MGQRATGAYLEHVPLKSHPSSTLACEIDSDLAHAGTPVLLSLRQAAAISGKSVDLLAKLARAGVLRASRGATTRGDTGHWRVTRRDLSAYLAGTQRQIKPDAHLRGAQSESAS